MNLSLDHPVLQALAWTLLHFLWQGALLGLMARTGSWLLRDRSPQARYLFACAVLVAMAAAPVATFLVLNPAALSTTYLIETSGAGTLAFPLAAAQQTSVLSWVKELNLVLRPLLPWALALWIAGVSLLSLRLLGGWIWLLRLSTRLAEPAGACWQMTLNGIARRMKVNMDVRILRSWGVDTPMVVGWVKPLILVPASALVGLTPEALEAVLAHELAHVRRHDYLVNLIQSVIEVLLFYHPAVWWVSAQVRQERELCCDDAAVALCGDPLLYARALTSLEDLRGSALLETNLAPAAHGGNLMNRIQRLISPTLPPSPTRRAGLLAALAVTALGAGTVFRLQEAPMKPAEASTEGKRKTTNIMINEDSDRLRVKIQGDVKIRPDGKTDLLLAEGASFEISATDKDRVRRFKASREKGTETRTFSVNGKESPVDQAWLDQRLDQLQKLEAKTADARETAKSAEGKAKVAEEKAQRIEVRVRRVEKDGKVTVTEDVHGGPSTEEGPGKKRIVIKQLDGSGLAEIEELHGPGKVLVYKGSGGKVLKLDPESGKEKVFIFEGPDSRKIKIDVERITRDAREHAKQMKLHGKDLEGLHDRLMLIKPDVDFDFDIGSDEAPKAFRWNMKVPSPEHREKFMEMEKHVQQKEFETLRREIERLQQRLERLQQRMHGDGAPPPPPAPPKPPKAPRAVPGTPKPSTLAAPPAPPAAPRAPAAMSPPSAPPPPPGSEI